MWASAQLSSVVKDLMKWAAVSIHDDICSIHAKYNIIALDDAQHLIHNNDFMTGWKSIKGTTAVYSL